MALKKRSFIRGIGYFFLFVFLVDLWSTVEQLPNRMYSYLFYLSIGLLTAQRIFRKLKKRLGKLGRESLCSVTEVYSKVVLLRT